MPKLKEILGEIPYTAELYWQLRQKDSPTTVGMNLTRLRDALPDWIRAAENSPYRPQPGKKVLIFGMIHYWIEHTTLLALALAGMGHEVTLAFMPYAHWRKPENRFDLRRQNLYIRETLRPAERLIKVVSLFGEKGKGRKGEKEWGRRGEKGQGSRGEPDHRSPITNHQSPITNHRSLFSNLQSRAFRDTQYSLLTEEVEIGSELYNLRLARDTEMAQAALAYLTTSRPDAVITPNGSILEFGVLYQVARHLGIPVSTFEFGEQNYRMWMAQNDDVMRQDTTSLWNARNLPLTDDEWTRIRTMFEARQGARVWQTFARQWQTANSKGAQQIRADLGLDERPLAFLPTNVLGDSLTLGRQLFMGMTEWIRRNIAWFGEHPEYQLVVRVHPGEQIGWGPSTFNLLTQSFPEFPANVRVLPADSKINSYDLVDAARVGLVYTTTMGMEMAMIGKPVIVTGQTHYRGKGFTLDPESWEQYTETLQGALLNPDAYRPNQDAITRAWTYAYRFFFEYPQPFPWHIQHFWDCLKEWPLERVLSEDGMAEFGKTFACLTGQKILFNVES
ncbi:MAG: hypothetical protein Fur0022_15430 [Anaerolineales bacterium]